MIKSSPLREVEMRSLILLGILLVILGGCTESKYGNMERASDLYLRANDEFGIGHLDRAVDLCTDQIYAGNLSNEEMAKVHFFRAKLTAMKAYFLGGLPDYEIERVVNDLERVRTLDPDHVDARGIPLDPYAYAAELTQKEGLPNRRDDTAIQTLEDILAGKM
jgi:hypothetical protein